MFHFLGEYLKIICPCGNPISDSTDFISYKAHLIADQDTEDMESSFGANGISFLNILFKYSRAIYQCSQCHRLLLLHKDGLCTFSPDEPKLSQNLLRSVEGERWKRHLRGHWRGGKGEVWWGFGVNDEGYETEFDTWEKVESRYFEVFNRLKSQNILRESFLKKDGETLHQWPDK